MKLSALKASVYRIAGVKTTHQLKSQYAEIKPLDMRYKASWEAALQLLEKAAVEEPGRRAGFEDWLSNPPDEYKALFAEADAALGNFDEKITKAKRLTQTAQAMATSLEEFAEASVEEAQQLAKAAQGAIDISAQADLN